MTDAFPLIERLTSELDYLVLTPENHQAVVESNPNLVLFFHGNPKLYPESLDVAVILPELVKQFEGQFVPAVVSEEHDSFFKQRYSFTAWPSLVFVKNGLMIGAISKVQDWAVYIEQIQALLAANSHVENVIPTMSVNQEK